MQLRAVLSGTSSSGQSLKNLQISGFLRTGLEGIAFFSLAAAVFGVSFLYRDFAKIHFGPLYILDLIWLCFFGCALALGWFKKFPLVKQIQNPFMLGVVLFSAWGFFRFGADVLFSDRSVLVATRSRVIQHLIIFVYPLLWVFAGFWLGLNRIQWAKFLVTGLIFTQGIRNFWGDDVVNISVGSLLTVFFLWFWFNQKHRISRINRVILLGSGYLVLNPFCLMWLHSVQRTSFLILVVMTFMVPVLMENLKVTRRTLALSFKTLGLLVFGFISLSFLRWSNNYLETVNFKFFESTSQIDSEDEFDSGSANSTGEGGSQAGSGSRRSQKNHGLSGLFSFRMDTVKKDFLSAFQKGEDFPTAENPMPFQGRFRKFCWLTALSDWKPKPLVGIGFVPEVPSFVEPNRPNKGGFEHAHSQPVSGPHNSYLSILVRMGILGFLIFAGTGVAWLLIMGNWIKNLKNPDVFSLLLIVIPINGAIHAFFNIGLESPHNSLIMWLVAGLGVAVALGQGKLDQVSNG